MRRGLSALQSNCPLQQVFALDSPAIEVAVSRPLEGAIPRQVGSRVNFPAGLLSGRILVTGGTGFIGQHVLRQAAGVQIEVYSLSTHRGQVPGIQYIRADLRDRGQLFRILSEVRPTGVLHLAAAGVSAGTDGIAHLLSNNVIGTENLLGAVHAAKLQVPVVIAGSGAEYASQQRPISEDDPVAPATGYGVAKAAAALCANWYARHFPITLLRLFNVYGPGEKTPRLVPYIVSRTQAGDPVELTSCEQIRDFVHAADVAQSFWRVLARPPQDRSMLVLNVGSGKPLTLRTFVEVVRRLLQEKKLEPTIVFGARPYRPGEPMTYMADTTRLRQYLGWTPGIQLDAGLRQTVESLLFTVMNPGDPPTRTDE